MSNIIQALRVALSVIPEVINIIKAVELPGSGADKAAAVLQIVTAAFQTLPADVASAIGLDKVQAFASKVIDIVVGFLNKVGVFKKTA